jgi:hypothetical protein
MDSNNQIKSIFTKLNKIEVGIYGYNQNNNSLHPDDLMQDINETEQSIKELTYGTEVKQLLINKLDEIKNKIPNGKNYGTFIGDEELLLERNKQVHSIEKELTELAELYKDINILIGDQGSMVNDIESNIFRAEHSVGKGADELKIAESYKKSVRIKYLLCTVIGLLILIVIALIVILAIFQK